MTPRRQRRDLVRPHVITGGRASPTRNTHRLDLITLLVAVPGTPTTDLGPEERRIVTLCRGGRLAVVDVSGRLGLPLTVTRVLIGDLLDSGHLVIHTPLPTGAPAAEKDTDPDVEILEKLLHGLRAL
ncbi:DUF742 domain-containing protein [Streptomyces calidiresistens]|uniref:DUF742 domain-containing protein n=1 Tax=Streptomyces calidiresistens TaxID=1485586 RepID=A0A7W3T7X0_9ACTN|nr:DUF742 domain-containing protein [Streptomyces calidiresistens]MBB0232589.1 DUF742 domain-containing protein [Streptomyces calidiresistens]